MQCPGCDHYTFDPAAGECSNCDTGKSARLEEIRSDYIQGIFSPFSTQVRLTSLGISVNDAKALIRQWTEEKRGCCGN
jgi:hypothetical protein